jgi:hypothetical protein
MCYRSKSDNEKENVPYFRYRIKGKSSAILFILRENRRYERSLLRWWSGWRRRELIMEGQAREGAGSGASKKEAWFSAA